MKSRETKLLEGFGPGNSTDTGNEKKEEEKSRLFDRFQTHDLGMVSRVLFH